MRQLVQTLPVGAKLPPERDLAVICHCNFLTVRKALAPLVEDGSIVRRVGSGTFVARKRASSAPARQTVGMLVCQNADAYAFRLMQALGQTSAAEGVELRSGWVSDLAGEALALAHRFQKEGCVALTLPWFPHEKSEEVRALIQRSPLPISVAMLIPGLERHCHLRPDAFAVTASGAIDDLCRYFLHLGQRRIAFLGPDPTRDAVLQQRLNTYLRFTSRENLPQLSGFVETGAASMDRLAQRWSTFRGELAVISYDDEHALRFMTAMHKLNLSAPGDYRIVGYNDTEGSGYSDPPLSTVHQNFEAIARALLQNAVGLARNEPGQSPTPPQPTLLVRATCGGRGKLDASLQLPGIGITPDGNFPPHS